MHDLGVLLAHSTGSYCSQYVAQTGTAVLPRQHLQTKDATGCQPQAMALTPHPGLR